MVLTVCVLFFTAPLSTAPVVVSCLTCSPSLLFTLVPIVYTPRNLGYGDLCLEVFGDIFRCTHLGDNVSLCIRGRNTCSAMWSGVRLPSYVTTGTWQLWSPLQHDANPSADTKVLQLCLVGLAPIGEEVPATACMTRNVLPKGLSGHWWGRVLTASINIGQRTPNTERTVGCTEFSPKSMMTLPGPQATNASQD